MWNIQFRGFWCSHRVAQPPTTPSPFWNIFHPPKRNFVSFNHHSLTPHIPTVCPMRKLCCDDKKLLCLNMSRLRLLFFQVTETRTKLAWAKGRINFLTRSMDALNNQTMGRENMQLDLRNNWKEGPECCQDSSFSSLLFTSSFVPLQTTFLHVVGNKRHFPAFHCLVSSTKEAKKPSTWAKLHWNTTGQPSKILIDMRSGFASEGYKDAVFQTGYNLLNRRVVWWDPTSGSQIKAMKVIKIKMLVYLTPCA